jgi:hypothetical protein
MKTAYFHIGTELQITLSLKDLPRTAQQEIFIDLGHTLGVWKDEAAAREIARVLGFTKRKDT